jgi:hypothetical protein
VDERKATGAQHVTGLPSQTSKSPRVHISKGASDTELKGRPLALPRLGNRGRGMRSSKASRELTFFHHARPRVLRLIKTWKGVYGLRGALADAFHHRVANSCVNKKSNDEPTTLSAPLSWYIGGLHMCSVPTHGHWAVSHGKFSYRSGCLHYPSSILGFLEGRRGPPIRSWGLSALQRPTQMQT